MAWGSRRKKKTLQLILAAVVVIFIFIATVSIVIVSQNNDRSVAEPETTAPTTTITTVTTTTTTTTTTAVTTYNYKMHIDLEKVKDHHETNSDVVGWVYINDTVIDYPIVQGEDNDYYIDKDWQGNPKYAGSIFEDFRGEIGVTENTLLYGHNMGDGSMFHAVKNFKEEDWGKKHRFFEVATLDKRYLYGIVACSVLDGEKGADFEYWNCVGMNKKEFEDYIKQMKDTALVWYADKKYKEWAPEWGDKTIALQTCNSGNHDGIRCILFGVCLGEY